MAHAKEAFTSPLGNPKWTFVEGKGKEDDKGNCKYQTVIRVHESAKGVKEKMDRIDEFWKENKPKQAKPRPVHKAYKFEEDDETGEKTGYVLFGFSTSTTWPSGDTKQIKIFTAGNPKKDIPVREVALNGKKIGEESRARAIGTLAIYEYEKQFGTTLFLDAMQLTKFVEYVGGIDASDVEAIDDEESEGEEFEGFDNSPDNLPEPAEDNPDGEESQRT
jgi:hypothetical protein